MAEEMERHFGAQQIGKGRVGGIGVTAAGNALVAQVIEGMRSTYGAAMTVTFMNAWNSYLWPKIVFQSNASITMPMLVANLKSGYSVDYGMLMLGVLICTLPTAIIFLCLQKSFANGITGAVK